MKLNQSLELDSLPPEVAGRGDIHSVKVTSSREAKLTAYSFGTAEFALVPAGDSPSPQECTLLVKTQPVGTVAMTIGRTVCAVSDQGRPTLITLTAVDQEAQSVGLDLTVWEKPE
ncbi:hypothetical protein [Streptomyces sp. YS-3]|uniref:hypothetical protein n=1 Tax=Streptomyces sp. YS-3 TaxID=3381352 RepID=UPI0038623C92